MLSKINEGEYVRLTATFDAAAPEPVQVTVLRPDRQVDGPFEMVRASAESAQAFALEYRAEQAGFYRWRVETAPPESVAEGSFSAAPRQVPSPN